MGARATRVKGIENGVPVTLPSLIVFLEDFEVKKGLTKAEHMTVGEKLKRMTDELTDLQVLIGNQLGKSVPERQQIKRAITAITMLRADLETRLLTQDPKDPDLLHVYFGSRVAKMPSLD